MKVGHVHGRFQPFHKGHAKYVKWAFENCDQLIVGVTNADPGHIEAEDADPERHKQENNPYLYFERQRMIESFLKSEKIRDSAQVTPFPINRPELWEYYAPKDITHFIVVLEDWHREKAQRLRNKGRTVRTMDRNRQISATEIRNKMRNNQRWESDVPDAVAATIHSLDIELPRHD